MQAKLRAGYTNRERAAQLAEKTVKDYKEKVINRLFMRLIFSRFEIILSPIYSKFYGGQLSPWRSLLKAHKSASINSDNLFIGPLFVTARPMA